MCKRLKSEIVKFIFKIEELGFTFQTTGNVVACWFAITVGKTEVDGVTVADWPWAVAASLVRPGFGSLLGSY